MSCIQLSLTNSVSPRWEEKGNNNAVVRTYTWGLDIRESSQGAGEVAGLLMVNAGSGGIHFPAYDLNGNVMGLVKAADRTISTRYEYGPFGEVFCSVGELAEENPFQFSTKYTDFETDLVYYGYRYYSPDLGRWISRDPIEEQGGFNLYAFVNNDPVNKFDILGLFFCGECKEGDVRNFYADSYFYLSTYPYGKKTMELGKEILSALDIISYLQFTSGMTRGVAIGIEKGIVGALPEFSGNTATLLVGKGSCWRWENEILKQIESIGELLLKTQDLCVAAWIKWEICIEKDKKLSWEQILVTDTVCAEFPDMWFYDDSKFLIEKKRKELEIRLYREYFIPFVRNINLNKYQYKSAC